MYIINKYIDWLCAGGLSLLVYAVIYFFDIDLMVHGIGVTAFLLANFINHPHFMASYGFLYVDERRKLLSNLYYVLVSFVVPGILLSIFLYAIVAEKPEMLGYTINLMFFMVGLHYVRQIYGVGLISLVKMKIFLSSDLKKILNYTLMPAWFLSYLNGNSGVFNQSFYGISYTTFAIPSFLKDANTILFYLSTAIWVAVIVYIVYTHKKWPVTLMIVLASISLWHLPSFYDLGFSYIIPLFHSLQYLLIVAAVKKNQIGASKRYLKYFAYMAAIGVTGYLFFVLIPHYLDGVISYNKELFGGSLFLAMFLLFINIHHYFIDAIIWRRGSDIVKHV